MKAWFLSAKFAFLLFVFLSASGLQADPEIRISSEEFYAALPDALRRVDEFEFIRKEARKLGVRIWLFGGSTASFGNYVRWHLLHQKGDAHYQSEKFDFDFLSIFRGNQDLDLVIDGTVEQAKVLERILNMKFPYFKGGQSTWEIRLLKEDRGGKEKLWDNPDFIKQNSDSASTSLCEITAPENNEERMIDLRDLEHKKNPVFLQDLLEGRIQFYDSNQHFETQRYRDQKNPKIISAIRYLTKVFQFEYRMQDADYKRIREIIKDFKPEELRPTDYLYGWLQRNAIKLYENAVDVEWATQVMNDLGLRKKLRDVGGNIEEVGTLAWWMNKEPLESREVGGGDPRQKTAEQLGLSTVSHSTKTLTAWECITRSPIGKVNFFKSRMNTSGESALHGDGLYALEGEEGAGGAELTVQMKLDPKARVGWDFDIVSEKKGERMLLIYNRMALRLLPQKYMEPMEYFQAIASGALDPSDISAPLRRRIHKRLLQLGRSAQKRIDRFVESQWSDEKPNLKLIQEWLGLPHLPQLRTSQLHFLLQKNVSPDRLLSTSFSNISFKNSPARRKQLFENIQIYYEWGGLEVEPLRAWLQTKPSLEQLKTVSRILVEKRFPYAKRLDVRNEWAALSSDLADELAKPNAELGSWRDYYELFYELLFSKEKWMRPTWLRRNIRDPHQREPLAKFVLSNPRWIKTPEGEEMIEEYINAGYGSLLFKDVLSQDGWIQNTKFENWLDRIEQDLSIDRRIGFFPVLGALNQKWKKTKVGEGLLDRLIMKNAGYGNYFLIHIALNPYWKTHPRYVQWMETAQVSLFSDVTPEVEKKFVAVLDALDGDSNFAYRTKIPDWRRALKVAKAIRLNACAPALLSLKK